MSCLKVRNTHFDKILRVSLHAIDRWMQRSSGDIRESLARAIPFGGQYKSAMMLIDGDIVFVLQQQKWTVTTVLTKDQAIANIEMTTGHRVNHLSQQQQQEKPEKPEKPEIPLRAYAGGLVAEAPPAVAAAVSEKKFPTKRAEEADLMLRFTRMFRMSDEELAEEVRLTRDKLWRKVCEREQGIRRQIAKYKQEIAAMETERR